MLHTAQPTQIVLDYTPEQRFCLWEGTLIPAGREAIPRKAGEDELWHRLIR